MAAQFRAPFRGDIWEFFEHAPMGRRFANEGEPFNIETACYLKEPMQTIRTRPFGKFVGMAGVQTLKTHALIEQPAGFFMFNDPGDTLIFVTGDESADDQAKGRTMQFWKGQKDLAQLFSDVASASPTGRHDIGTYELYLPGMVLGIWPLNLSSTQRNTIRYVFITDAFLCERSGLIEQAIARTSQHNSIRVRDYKIVIESQGGEVGDDFEKQWESTDGRRLHVKCQACGQGQEFLWHRKRPDDFVPTPMLEIPSLDHAAWIAHNRPLLMAEDRIHAGMNRGDAAVKRADGSYDADEVRHQTTYQCYHCGWHWMDIPRIREEIDRSSYYVPSIAGNPPENVGWWWPKWCGQRLSWGDEMLFYLKALSSMKQGSFELLKQWRQKHEAGPWYVGYGQPESAPSVTVYDVDKAMPDELFKQMAVDVQQDMDVMAKTGKSVPGWFWYEIEAIDKFGNSRQLERGHCTSWEHWIERQKFWKIPNDRVGIDVGHWPDIIMQRAAAERKEYEVAHALAFLRKRTRTWLCMLDSPERDFIHGASGRKEGKRDEKRRPWSPEQPFNIPVNNPETGKITMVTVKRIRWSGVAFNLQLDNILAKTPGTVTCEILPREKLDEHTKQMETGTSTYEKQMESEIYSPVRGKDAYAPAAQSRPAHYRDLRRMSLVLRAREGLIGHLAVE